MIVDITWWELMAFVAGYMIVIVVLYKLKPEWFKSENENANDDFFWPPG